MEGSRSSASDHHIISQEESASSDADKDYSHLKMLTSLHQETSLSTCLRKQTFASDEAEDIVVADYQYQSHQKGKPNQMNDVFNLGRNALSSP